MIRDTAYGQATPVYTHPILFTDNNFSIFASSPREGEWSQWSTSDYKVNYYTPFFGGQSPKGSISYPPRRWIRWIGNCKGSMRLLPCRRGC